MHQPRDVTQGILFTIETRFISPRLKNDSRHTQGGRGIVVNSTFNQEKMPLSTERDSNFAHFHPAAERQWKISGRSLPTPRSGMEILNKSMCCT